MRHAIRVLTWTLLVAVSSVATTVAVINAEQAKKAEAARAVPFSVTFDCQWVDLEGRAVDGRMEVSSADLKVLAKGHVWQLNLPGEIAEWKSR